MNKTLLIVVIVVVLIAILAIYYITSNKNLPAENQNTTNQSNSPTPSSSSFAIQGMKVEVLQKGSGPEVKANDYVTVDYVGTLENGTKFDSSIDRGVPFKFYVGQGQVIKGWDLGVAGMKVGEKRKLTIPPELGYGTSGAGALIPPNATLIFEVSLLKIN